MKELNVDEIKKNLNYECGKIKLFESIDSTSSWLLENGACGDVCLSETQTAGRGRRGNQWASPDAGNIYFSMCWCFKEITEHWSLLGLLVGTTVADALEELGLQGHGVKWPNDIFWQGRKLGGILLESQNQSGRVVIGIGLNINMQDNLDQALSKVISQPWVSLQEALGSKLMVRNQIVAIMMNHLQAMLLEFSKFNIDSFLRKWKIWDVLEGRLVIIQQNGIESSGKVMGIDKQGRIGILLDNQKIHYYSSADIKLVSGMNS